MTRLRDPRVFPGYPEKLKKAQEKTGMNEAVVTALGTIGGQRCVVGVLDSRFLMGSMSAAVGEKLTLAIEYAGKTVCPSSCFVLAVGPGCREGILSLMQMAKTSTALGRHAQKGTAVHLRSHGPHHRRRHRQLCLVRRHYSGRARCAYRLRRAPGHSADHRPDPAGGLSAGGVSDGARLCGCRGPPEGSAGHPHPSAEAPREGRQEWKN